MEGGGDLGASGLATRGQRFFCEFCRFLECGLPKRQNKKTRKKLVPPLVAKAVTPKCPTPLRAN